MAVATTAYPEFEEQVRDLVAQHRKLRDGRLRLAVYFAPPGRRSQDIFLFEVLEGFADADPDAEDDLFEFEYGSTPGLPLPPGIKLRMILTNPAELERAIAGNWKGIAELRKARQAGRATVIYTDARGKDLWGRI